MHPTWTVEHRRRPFRSNLTPIAYSLSWPHFRLDIDFHFPTFHLFLTDRIRPSASPWRISGRFRDSSSSVIGYARYRTWCRSHHNNYLHQTPSPKIPRTTCRQNNRQKSQSRDEGGTHNLKIVIVSTHLTPALPFEPCGQWITMSLRSKRRLSMAEDEEHSIQGTQALS